MRRGNICIHHTDAERSEPQPCPICNVQRVKALESALRFASTEVSRREEKMMESNRVLLAACEHADNYFNDTDLDDIRELCDAHDKLKLTLKAAIAHSKGQS